MKTIYSRLMGAAVVLAAVSPGLLAGQAGVLLRLAPPEGQTSRYRIETSTTIEGQFGSVTVRQLMVMTQNVLAVEQNVRRLETVMDSIRFVGPAPPEAVAAIAGLRGARREIRMDTRGQVLDEVGGAGPVQAGLPSGFVLPERAVTPGATWEDSVAAPPGMPGPASVTRVRYRLERIEARNGARIALITGAGNIAGTGPDGAQAEGTLRGEMEIDLDAGRWVRNEMTVELRGPEGRVTMVTRGALVGG